MGEFHRRAPGRTVLLLCMGHSTAALHRAGHHQRAGYPVCSGFIWLRHTGYAWGNARQLLKQVEVP